MTRSRRILLFLSIAYGLSILAGIGLWMSGPTTSGSTQMLASVLTMFTPLVASLVVQKASGEALWTPIGGKPKWSWWLLWGGLIGFFATLLGVGLGGLMPGASLSFGVDSLLAKLEGSLTPEQLEAARTQMEALPVSPLLLALPQALLAGMTVNAIAAFGEEIGWRGFLHRELRHLGFWRASLFTGIAWGFWHAPLILNGHNYPSQPVIGVFLFTVVCVLMSPMHALVREKAGSVWAAATMHGTINAVATFSGFVIVGGSELFVGMQGIAGVLALLVVNVVIFAALKRRPALDPVAEPAS